MQRQRERGAHTARKVDSTVQLREEAARRAEQVQRRQDNENAVDVMRCECGSGRLFKHCCQREQLRSISLRGAFSNEVLEAGFREDTTFDNEFVQ